MHPLRIQLLGIALTLSAGFVLLHDVLRFEGVSGSLGDGAVTVVPYTGVVLGLVVVAAGFVAGARRDVAAD